MDRVPRSAKKITASIKSNPRRLNEEASGPSSKNIYDNKKQKPAWREQSARPYKISRAASIIDPCTLVRRKLVNRRAI